MREWLKTWDKTRTSLLLYLRKAIQDQSRYVSSVRHGNEITDRVRKTQEVDVQSKTVSNYRKKTGSLMPLSWICFSKFWVYRGDLKFYWTIVGLQYFITIRCTTLLSNISIDNAPYKVHRLLLTIFPVLYITSSWLIYFINGSFYLLILFTYFLHLPLHFPHCKH